MPRVALVHDYLLVMRGAERTFATMTECWPEATIYTLLYDEEGTQGRFASRRIQTSYLQRLRLGQRGFRAALPLFPRAAERLLDEGHDLVVSSSSAFAHGVRPAPRVPHVSYCHTPFRYAWHERQRALEEVPRPMRPVIARVLDRVRAWDLAASRRVDSYIAISALSQRRIKESWGRCAPIVHPPVEIGRFSPGTADTFFLVVTELVRHKRVEVALAAARSAGERVKVVGTGPELASLRAEFGATADFLGRVGDNELNDLYARARALIVPNVEEFGIAAVEAQAAGRPVLAANVGGVRETVLAGETGVLVKPDDPDALASALREVDFDAFSTKKAVENARRFSVEAFKERLSAEVERAAAHVGESQRDVR